MASSKLMASRSPPNTDLPRQSSISKLGQHPDQSRGFGSMNMDEILRNLYYDSDSFSPENNGGRGSKATEGGGGMRNEKGTGNKTTEGAWRDVVNSGGGGPSGEPGMTFKDYLAKAGAMAEENVRVPAVVPMTRPAPPAGTYGMGTVMVNHVAGVPAVQFGSETVGVKNGGFGVDFRNGEAASGGSGRGKRRAAVEEAPLDKATQQKQRRMIKNRESAARSRERKQAYTVELESLVTQLEEDNARLLRKEEELNKERYKQLMENLIPVTEKGRPPRILRRVGSMEW